MCRPRRTIARQERGGVYGVQASGSYVPDDDRFHAIDSVNADDFGVRHHRQPTVVRIRGSVEASAKALRRSRAARTQHNQHAPAALHRVGGGGERGPVVAGQDEIDGSWRTAR
jgi:hypothetical protein